MDVEPGRWLRLNPDNIAGLPEDAGVFEIANLVRNVLYIGRGDGSLRRRFTEMGHLPVHLPASTGGYFFRFMLTAEEQQEMDRRVEAYRARHAGRAPLGNMGGRPLRLAARRAA
ncbi:MAG: hypothetical protein KIT14_22900 [bacterium]|nr:hypothetical protein [bacterium]